MKKLALALLIALLASPAFGASAFTKIGTVGPTATTYTDSSGVDGTTYVYYVTAVDAESLPSNLTYATIPASGTHTVVLTWTLSTSPGVVSQNVYRGIAPNPPTNVVNTVN